MQESTDCEQIDQTTATITKDRIRSLVDKFKRVKQRITNETMVKQGMIDLMNESWKDIMGSDEERD